MGSRDLWRLDDEQLLVKLRDSQRRLSREYGEQLVLLGEVLARNLPAVFGYRRGRLLRDMLRIGPVEANRRLTQAQALTAGHSVTGADVPAQLPATAEAVRSGAIGAEHVEVIRRVVTELPPHIEPQRREAAETTLVQAAHTLDPVAVAALGRAITARLDQDGRPPSEAEARTPVNELRWTQRADGGLALAGRLAAEGAALLTTVLGPLAKPRPAHDGHPDPRSRAERHGDALLDALRLAANSGDLPAEGGERPTLLVTVPLDTLRQTTPPTRLDDLVPRQRRAVHDDDTGVRARPDRAGPSPNGHRGRDRHDPVPPSQAVPPILGDNTIVDAGLARRLACDSAVIPAILGGRSEPLDIGRKTRTIPAAMRRALVLRDRGCAFPGCVVPARWCDAHHRIHWADGGRTAIDNLVLLCRHHHDLMHHSQWQVRIAHGQPEFTPPHYIDPDRHPRRNPIHHT